MGDLTSEPARPDAAAQAPAVGSEWVASPDWRAIDFISDLHLERGSPKTFAAWRDHMVHTTADAVVILGDWLELWVGDDQREGEFESQCVDVLGQATSQRTVAFMAGNRDFLIGEAMLRATGMQRLADPTLVCAFGERVLLSHGDALCLADLPYQQFRAMVRDDGWQQRFLALPFTERMRIGTEVRHRSEQNRHGGAPSEMSQYDVDTDAALQWMRPGDARILVHGHTHRPGTQTLDGDGRVRHVLSDWDLDRPPHRAEVMRWSADGWHRIAPASGSNHP